MKILYYNPKNNRYITTKVLSIDKDIVHCLNVKANYSYTESLSKLIELSKAENPNWHGESKKPLVKLVGFGGKTNKNRRKMTTTEIKQQLCTSYKTKKQTI